MPLMSEDVGKSVQYIFPIQLAVWEQDVSMHGPISNRHPPSLMTVSISSRSCTGMCLLPEPGAFWLELLPWVLGSAGPVDGACPARQTNPWRKQTSCCKLPLLGSCRFCPSSLHPFWEGLDYMPNPFRIRLT